MVVGLVNYSLALQDIILEISQRSYMDTFVFKEVVKNTHDTGPVKELVSSPDDHCTLKLSAIKWKQFM